MGLAFAFACAIAFVLFDVTRKQIPAEADALNVTAWLQIASLPFLLIWVCVSPIGSLSLHWWPYGLASVVVQASANLLFLIALRIGSLSQTVPFLALTPLLSGLASWLLLKEQPSYVSQLGMLLVTIGAFMLAANKGFALARGSLLAIVVAALWSLGGAIDKQALRYAPSSLHALLITLGILAIFGSERLIRKGWTALRPPSIGPIMLAGSMGSLAFGLQLAALELSYVAVVETVKRGVGGVAALALGRLAFKEHISLRIVLAVMVMTIGTILVLWPNPT